MAENVSPQQIQQDVILNVLTQISGHLETIKGILDQKKALESANKSIQSHQRHLQQTSVILKHVRKSAMAFNAGLISTAKRGIGAATAALGIFIGSVKQTGETLTRFQATSANATGSIGRLRESYAALGVTAENTTLSIMQAAEALTEFQSRGVAQAVAATGQAFQTGMIGFTKIIQESFGSDYTKNIGEMLAGVDDQFGFMKKQVEDIGKFISSYEISLGVGDTAAAEKNLLRVRDIVETIGRQADESGRLAAMQLSAQVETLAANLRGGNEGAVQSTIALNKAWAAFKAVLEQVQDTILITVGPPFAEILDQIRSDITGVLIPAIRNFGDTLNSLNWQQIKAQAIDTWHSIYGAIESVVQTMKTLYDWFSKLSPMWKKAIGYGTAFVALFGVRNTVSLFFNTFSAGFKKLFAHFAKGTALARAMCAETQCEGIGRTAMPRSLSGAGRRGLMGAPAARGWRGMMGTAGRAGLPRGMTALSGGRFGGGIAATAGLGVGGHFLGRGVAEALGAESHGVTQAFTGMASTFAVVSAQATPFVGLIAAAGSGILSMGQAVAATWQEAEKANAALEEQKKKTAELRQVIESLPNITPYDDARKQKLELEVQLSELTDKNAGSTFREFFTGERYSKEDRDKIDQLREKIRKLSEEAKAVRPPEMDMEVDPSSLERINQLQQERLNVSKQLKVGETDATARKQILDQIDAIDKLIGKEQNLGSIRAEKMRAEAQIQEIQLHMKSDPAGLNEAEAQIRKLQKRVESSDVKLSIMADNESLQESQKALEELQKRAKDGINLDTTDFESKITSARKQAEELRKKIEEADKQGIQSPVDQSTIDAIEDLTKHTENAANAANKAREGFRGVEEQLKLVAGYSENIQHLSSALGQFGTLIEGLGPSAQLAGRAVGDMLQENLTFALAHTNLIQAASTSAIKLAEQQRAAAIDNLNKMTTALQEAYASGDTERITQSEKNRVDALNQVSKLENDLNRAREQSVKASQLIKQSVESLGKPYEEQLSYEQDITSLVETRLRMSQATYGTAALAVTQQLDYVKALDAQRKTLQKELEIYQERLDQAKQQGADAQTIWTLRRKTLQVEKSMRDVQAQQLESIKELRDGYLSAVEAQAFSAGRFEKILITQDKNLGYGLDKNIVKANFLLGAVGKVAQASNAQPYKFGAGGYGALETMGGQALSRDDIQGMNQEIIKNIADPASKAAAQASQQILNDIYPAFDESFSDNVDATNALTQAVQDNTDAHQAFIKSMLGAVGGLGAISGKAGQTLVGESVRRALEGLPPPDAPPAAGRIPTINVPDTSQFVRSQLVQIQVLEEQKQVLVDQSVMLRRSIDLAKENNSNQDYVGRLQKRAVDLQKQIENVQQQQVNAIKDLQKQSPGTTGIEPLLKSVNNSIARTNAIISGKSDASTVNVSNNMSPIISVDAAQYPAVNVDTGAFVKSQLDTVRVLEDQKRVLLASAKALTESVETSKKTGQSELTIISLQEQSLDVQKRISGLQQQQISVLSGITTADATSTTNIPNVPTQPANFSGIIATAKTAFSKGAEIVLNAFGKVRDIVADMPTELTASNSSTQQLDLARANADKLQALKDAVEATRKAKDDAAQRVAAASEESYKILSTMTNRPGTLEMVPEMLSHPFPRQITPETAPKMTAYAAADRADKEFPEAKAKENAAIAAAQAANKSYDMAWSALNKFYQNVGFESKIEEQIKEAEKIQQDAQKALAAAMGRKIKRKPTDFERALDVADATIKKAQEQTHLPEGEIADQVNSIFANLKDTIKQTREYFTAADITTPNPQDWLNTFFADAQTSMDNVFKSIEMPTVSPDASAKPQEMITAVYAKASEAVAKARDAIELPTITPGQSKDIDPRDAVSDLFAQMRQSLLTAKKSLELPETEQGSPNPKYLADSMFRDAREAIKEAESWFDIPEDARFSETELPDFQAIVNNAFEHVQQSLDASQQRAFAKTKARIPKEIKAETPEIKLAKLESIETPDVVVRKPEPIEAPEISVPDIGTIAAPQTPEIQDITIPTPTVGTPEAYATPEIHLPTFDIIEAPETPAIPGVVFPTPEIEAIDAPVAPEVTIPKLETIATPEMPPIPGIVLPEPEIKVPEQFATPDVTIPKPQTVELPWDQSGIENVFKEIKTIFATDKVVEPVSDESPKTILGSVTDRAAAMLDSMKKQYQVATSDTSNTVPDINIEPVNIDTPQSNVGIFQAMLDEFGASTKERMSQISESVSQLIAKSAQHAPELDGVKGQLLNAVDASKVVDPKLLKRKTPDSANADLERLYEQANKIAEAEYKMVAGYAPAPVSDKEGNTQSYSGAAVAGQFATNTRYANIHGYDMRGYNEIKKQRQRLKPVAKDIARARDRVNRGRVIEAAQATADQTTNITPTMASTAETTGTVTTASLAGSGRTGRIKQGSLSGGGGGDWTKKMTIVANILIGMGAKVDEVSSQGTGEPSLVRQSTYARNLPG